MSILGGIINAFDGSGDTIIIIPATSAAVYEPYYLLSQIKTVDGSGSDLDADLLDGYHATHFGTAAQIQTLQNVDVSLQSQINNLFAVGSRLVYRENFTGNGTSTNFVLTGALQNAGYTTGSWSAANVLTALQADATDLNGKAIYDSVIPIYRDRINVSTIDSFGNVTLDHIPQAGQQFSIWYWYQLTSSDVLSYYYREDHVAEMEADGVQTASQVDVFTSSFGNIVLRTTDNTVQKALDRLDDYVELQALSGSQDLRLRAEVIAISGDLQAQINSINVVGGTNVSVVEGPINTFTVSTLGDISRAEVGVITGGLQQQINAIVQESTTISSSGASIVVTQNGHNFNLEVATAPIQNHNSLNGLQGGSAGEYYHLTASEYANISGAGSVNTSVQLPWKYDRTTTASDPGNGKFRLNNTTVGSATALYISKKTDSGIDAYNILRNMDVGDRIYLQNSADASEAIIVTVSGTITNNTSWFSIPFTVDGQATSTTFTDKKVFSFLLINTTHVDLSAYTLLSTTASISGNLQTQITNEVSARIAADLLLTPLSTTANISGGLNTRLTTVENNYATKATPVAGTYNTVSVNGQGIVTAGSNADYATNSTVASVSGSLQNQININTTNIAAISGSSGSYVPYTGATSNVNLGTRKLTADALVLNQSPVTAVAPGQISWNASDKTFDMGLTSAVTLQVGQEELTRVYNGTASVINNGQPVYITAIVNDDPSVALASAIGSIGADTQTVCAGIATETISPSGHGFITNRGKVRGLNTAGYTTGQTIYLGETPGTFTAQTSGFAYGSHVNPIGYVGLVDSISGSVFVNIRNESALLSLSERETNVVLGNSISNGVYEYTGMTIATSASFTVPAMKGWIVENTGVYATQPFVLNVIYPGATLPVTNIATQDFTYVLVDRNNAITQQSTFPTPQDRRDKIWLGKIVHMNRASISVINNTVDYNTSPFSAVRDMFTALPLINDGVTPYPAGANLSFNKSAGDLYGMGINWTNNQKSPNKVSLSSSLPVSFFYATRTTIASSTTTLVVPTNYDVGGTITALPGGGGTATNQRIYQFPTGAVVVQYGQTSYTSLTNAIAGTQTESFVKHPATFGSAVLIGILSITKNCTDISDTTRARFTPASAFGEVTGGTSGISTTTLQQAYDNSSNPEILINSTLDGVTIKNGTGNADNVTRLIEGQNTAGTVTSFILADGTFNSAYSIVNSISGASGSIVTHDASGKLLDSGILATSLASTTTVASISGSLNTRLTTVENNYATKAAPVAGTYNTVTVNGQGIVTSGSNVDYATNSTVATVSGGLNTRVTNLENAGYITSSALIPYALTTTVASISGSLAVDGLHLTLEGPSVRAYDLAYRMNYAGTITNSYYTTETGSIVGSVTINGNNVGGLNGLTIGTGSATATSTNTFAVGDRIRLNVTSVTAGTQYTTLSLRIVRS
jgi:hypothetical protein